MALLLAVASFGVLVAIFKEALSAFPGADRALVERATRQSRFLGVFSPVFGAIGVLVCLYQGARALLWWIPEDWKYRTDAGEPLSMRSILSFGFAFAVGWIVFDRWRALRQMNN